EIGSKEEIERARIASERGLDEARIGHETERRRLEVGRERDVESAQMEKAITLYKKSLEESAARADADQARARAVEAEERVKTARETEEANRRRSIDLVMADKAAEEAKLAASAEKIRRAVEAEAQKLLNEAENVLTDPARQSLFRRKLLEHVEGIVSASVKPLEKIQDIRIMQLDGIGNGGGGERSNMTDEVINSALRYRVQAPLVDSLLADIGIEGGGLARQGGLIREAADMQRIANDAKKEAQRPAEGGGGDSSAGTPAGRPSGSRSKKPE
ncbi:MAG: flotillin domain-containing protein, partial [Pseudorhodoplanes sp.]